MTIYNDILIRSNITPTCNRFTHLDLFNEFETGLHAAVATVVTYNHADRGCLFLWTPGPVRFETCICSSYLFRNKTDNPYFELLTSLVTQVLFYFSYPLGYGKYKKILLLRFIHHLKIGFN